jgi:hypothetical protein
MTIGFMLVVPTRRNEGPRSANSFAENRNNLSCAFSQIRRQPARRGERFIIRQTNDAGDAPDHLIGRRLLVIAFDRDR